MVQPRNEHETRCLVSETTENKNRYANRSGFSPHQRVFGSSWRLPASIASDDHVDPHLLSSNPSEDFQRSMEIRSAAQQAYMKVQASRVIQASQQAKSRTQPGETLPVGTTVFVWRKSPLGRQSLSRWVGPGVLVMNSTTGTTCWISIRGMLLKCSKEQVRKASNE